jgi:hypothetical protein
MILRTVSSRYFVPKLNNFFPTIGSEELEILSTVHTSIEVRRQELYLKL